MRMSKNSLIVLAWVGGFVVVLGCLLLLAGTQSDTIYLEPGHPKTTIVHEEDGWPYGSSTTRTPSKSMRKAPPRTGSGQKR
jgi:hypothetical protein